jgi:GAF domain-containing protein
LSGSHGDINRLFDTILSNATNLCQANFGTLLLYEGDAFRVVAQHNAPPAYAELRRREPLVRGRPLLRIAETKQLAHIADIREYVVSNPADKDAAAFVKLSGVRTILTVPMLKDGEVVGAIAIYRQEVRAFKDREIALLKSFAAQAVIAIENARLLNELRQRTDDLSQRTADLTEALDQQVISSSPGDLEPVFATMLKEAVRICDANSGGIYRVEGDAMRLVAIHNVPPPYAEARRLSPFHPGPKHILGRTMLTKSVVQIADAATDPGYVERRPEMVAAVELGGVRTMLGVPMLKENNLVGVFALNRQQVRPFTDKQIEVVKNFAAQAVIAIAHH